MNLGLNYGFSDTLTGTTKSTVSINVNFILRKTSSKESCIYLHLSSNNQRERFSLGIKIKHSEWYKEKQRLKAISEENKDINLILDNLLSKITSTKTTFRLSDKSLTPKVLKEEILNGMPRVRFTAFFRMALDSEKVLLKIGTYKRYESVLKKIIEFDDDITFMDIDTKWIDKYIKHLRKKENKATTVSSNLAAIKKFLGIANKNGIRLSINIQDIKPGSTKGNRTCLNQIEMNKALGYYLSEYISENNRLVLGYFLFSCMTGLRISDLQKLERKNLNDNYISFVTTKTDKDQSVVLNNTAKRIINHEPNLFVKKYADQTMNEQIKQIMIILDINKKVSFHVARHTFATNFLRAGGSAEKLQMLLGHSNITETMAYVHIVQSEANAEIFLLDNLF